MEGAAASKVGGMSASTTAFCATGSDSSAIAVARKAVTSLTNQSGLKIEQATQRPILEDDVMVLGDNTKQLSRLVFGPPPTLEESKEATSQLNDAIGQVYFCSPEMNESGGSLHSVGSARSLSTLQETNGVMQAFQLLRESPEAQIVVASLASDPNVWDAMSINPALLEFVESENKRTGLRTREPVKSSAVYSSSSNRFRLGGEQAFEKPDNFVTFLLELKSVADMIIKIKGFMERLFGASNAEKSERSDPPEDNTIRDILIKVAMIVILILVMKRPSI